MTPGWALIARPPGDIDEAHGAELARDLAASGLAGLTVHCTRRLPPRLTLVPFRRSPIVLVTLEGERDAAEPVREVLARRFGAGVALLALDTRVVVAPSRSRATLLTLFRQRPGLDRREFFRRWYDEHTPMTLEIHPVTGYVRSAVTEVVSGDERWDGIVTEDFAEERDLTSLRLFGRGPRALVGAVRVGLHVRSFLDLSTIETYLVHPIS